MHYSTQKIIKNKIGLLNLAEELGNVSKACKVMGFSRETFYRYQKAVADGGVDALMEKTRRKANPKNRVDNLTDRPGYLGSQDTFYVGTFQVATSTIYANLLLSNNR